MNTQFGPEFGIIGLAFWAFWFMVLHTRDENSGRAGAAQGIVVMSLAPLGADYFAWDLAVRLLGIGLMFTCLLAVLHFPRRDWLMTVSPGLLGMALLLNLF